MANSKVSVVVHDLSSNIVWAATALARALQREFEVEIVGPDLGGGVCPMYRDSFPYRVVSTPRLYRFPDFFRERRRLSAAVTGDVVIAVKAYADTVPVALEHKRLGKKALVYLDEWDAANYFQLPLAQRLRRWAAHAHHPLDDIYFPRVERLIRKADGVICTSTFLAKRFGGTVVPLGVDTELYAPPDPSQTRAQREALHLDDLRLIVFAGVVRQHKGIELILEALIQLGSPTLRLVVVGPVTDVLQDLQRNPRYAPWLVTTGPQPKDAMPRFLGLGDLVVLPQRATPLAQSQVPCKVFEAMAMARPIIATAVSDLPSILDGCGWIVPADNVAALAGAIEHVLNHPEEGRAKGARAREKCLLQYSTDVTSQTMCSIVRELLGRAS
jgi:glycosyltransferase involved in cell wall biosynthesis